MQPSTETQTLLEALGLLYLETILDRRGTLAIKVARDGKHAILKLQSEDGSEEASHKARLLEQEASVLSQIPRLTGRLYLDHGKLDGRNWLLIRSIDGSEMHQAAKQIRANLTGADARITSLTRLLRKVSGFYDALYAGGYLHGDVQPAHTYLEGDEVVVIDWGLSRKIHVPNPLYKGGFLYYVAPEIAERMRPRDSSISYTPYAEVYALGATLFLFYTGCLALDFGIPKTELQGIPMDEKLQRVVENRIFSFAEIGADPHPALEVLLRKSLSTTPEERFETPCQLHQNLLELSKS